MPLDPLRMLASSRSEDLIVAIAGEIDAVLPRQRARRPDDEERWRYALNVLLSNLALAMFNRIDCERFIAISFNANDYSGSALSVTALSRLRGALEALGLIEGQRGYRHIVDGMVRHARRTRIRGTAALAGRFARQGISRQDIGWSERRDIIILRAPDADVSSEPADVTASRRILGRLNAAITDARIDLPDNAWARVIEHYRASVEDEDDRLVAGEEATTLYRIFKKDWDCGGRLYGGWWINLPKLERRHLTIGGEAVVERDFARLHPTLLFARANVELNFDIYAVPGFKGPHVRDLGKRTFNRLVNKTFKGTPRLTATWLDRQQLPEGVSFRDYLEAFIEQIRPVSPWFGTGEGLRLQREDSDLALAILGALADQQIITLPVHDSFIVARRHEAVLVRVMTEQFAKRYGFEPSVR